MTLLHILDLLSVFVFALVGARVAADRGLDYGGIALVAIATSSLCGAIAFVALIAFNVDPSVSTITGGVVVALVRMLSIQFDLNLPRFKESRP